MACVQGKIEAINWVQ